jgi:flagellar hook-associated protein 2
MSSSVSAVNTLLSSTTATTPAISISNILAASTGATTPGIDDTAAVTAAIYADNAPERAWLADQATLTSQTSALTAIQTATEAIATDFQSLNTLSGPLAARTVNSSNSSGLTATAATGTATGTHSVVVDSLASTGAWFSSVESLPTTTLPTSTLTFIPATGKSVTFQTGSGTTGDTLADLASAINNFTDPITNASLGVTATVISDSTGSRLAIVSNSPGTAADFSMAEPTTTWSAPAMSSTDTLGVNSLVLSTAAGTTTITTTSGDTYATLAAAINNATISTSYSTSATTSLDSTTGLTAGSVTTIQDATSGDTFSYTAASGDTVATLNAAIAAAVSTGTLSANVTGSVIGGQEVISEGSSDQGVTVSTDDSALSTMGKVASATNPLGLIAATSADLNGNTVLTITGNSVTTGTGSSAVTTIAPFTINEPSATGTAFSFTQAVQAENASITVDGVPIVSASNTVTGAIPGVTLTLLGASPGSQISLTVASDTSQVSTAINQFVSDYNAALGLVNTQFEMTSTTSSTTSATTTSQGVLADDPTVRSLQSLLEQAIGYAYTPATGTTTVSNLSDLGITVADDGTLTVDSTTLNSALVNNPTDVQKFFEGPALNGFSNSIYNQLTTYTAAADGAFTVDLSSISASSAALTSQINDFETGYIASQQTSLTADFTAAEVALQQLPQEMQELNTELGFNSNGSSS